LLFAFVASLHLGAAQRLRLGNNKTGPPPAIPAVRDVIAAASGTNKKPGVAAGLSEFG
jgi:hypothetical protein